MHSQHTRSPTSSTALSYIPVKVVPSSCTSDEMDRLCRASAAPLATVSETDCLHDSALSNAEEEMAEERAACLNDPAAGYAADCDDGCEERSSDVHTHTNTATTNEHATGVSCAAVKAQGGAVSEPECAESGFYDHYVPVNTSQSRYSAEIAQTLRQAAQNRGFLSPVWSTSDAFGRYNVHVRAEELDFPTVVGLSFTDVRLFNLEQTNCINARSIDATAWTIAKMNYYDKMSVDVPLDLIGRPIRGIVRTQLISHAMYDEMCSRGPPVWAQLSHMDRLGIRVVPTEMRRYVKVAYSDEFTTYLKTSNSLQQSVPTVAPDWSAADAQRRPDIATSTSRYTLYLRNLRERLQIKYGNALGVDLTSCSLFYHISQMELTSATGECSRPLVLACNTYKPFVCYSLRGYCMSFTQTYIMQQYCAKYGLPTDGVAVFVTEHQMRNFQASLRSTSDTLSYLGAKPPQIISGHVECEYTTKQFPEPLSVIINDDVVSMYHAIQTDKHSDFERVMQNYRKKRCMRQFF